jgi:basic membrane lipoprotein Med (substrate-binding protein (PBP1-ABC) superfamily)
MGATAEKRATIVAENVTGKQLRKEVEFRLIREMNTSWKDEQRSFGQCIKAIKQHLPKEASTILKGSVSELAKIVVNNLSEAPVKPSKNNPKGLSLKAQYVAKTSYMNTWIEEKVAEIVEETGAEATDKTVQQVMNTAEYKAENVKNGFKFTPWGVATILRKHNS